MCELPHDVQNGLDVLAHHYEDFQPNDRGGNGYLFFATNVVSRQDVAIKFYAGEPGNQQHDEPRQLAAINSPNVLPILDARRVSNDWAYFITPRCREGDLDDLIQAKPSVHVALDTAIGVCRGVSAIHAQRVLHRDLKPANIVLDNGRPRIADFGSVKAIPEDATGTRASRHTIIYRPPESFSTDWYDEKGDVYQIGLVAYQLLGGALPYNGKEYLSSREMREYDRIADDFDRSMFIDAAIRRRAESGRLVRLGSLPPWISSAARSRIRAMIYPDPARRLSSVAEAVARLTQIRSRLSDWRWAGDYAELAVSGRTIQLRPTSGDLYEAFQRRRATFRRIPRMQAASLEELVRRLNQG